MTVFARIFICVCRIASALAYPALFGGYMFVIHYGWQRLQYSPVVNGGETPDTITFDKFRKVYIFLLYVLMSTMCSVVTSTIFILQLFVRETSASDSNKDGKK